MITAEQAKENEKLFDSNKYNNEKRYFERRYKDNLIAQIDKEIENKSNRGYNWCKIKNLPHHSCTYKFLEKHYKDLGYKITYERNFWNEEKYTLYVGW